MFGSFIEAEGSNEQIKTLGNVTLRDRTTSCFAADCQVERQLHYKKQSRKSKWASKSFLPTFKPTL